MRVSCERMHSTDVPVPYWAQERERAVLTLCAGASAPVPVPVPRFVRIECHAIQSSVKRVEPGRATLPSVFASCVLPVREVSASLPIILGFGHAWHAMVHAGHGLLGVGAPQAGGGSAGSGSCWLRARGCARRERERESELTHVHPLDISTTRHFPAACV